MEEMLRVLEDRFHQVDEQLEQVSHVAMTSCDSLPASFSQRRAVAVSVCTTRSTDALGSTARQRVLVGSCWQSISVRTCQYIQENGCMLHSVLCSSHVRLLITRAIQSCLSERICCSLVMN